VRWKRAALFVGAVVLLLAGAAWFLLRTETGGHLLAAILEAGVRGGKLSVREMVLLEHPELMGAIARGGAFGGEFSRTVAENMFSREGPGVAEARAKTRVEALAPRTWLVRLPIVNVVLFETDEGLVLVDTAMAPGGPAVLEAIRSVSQAPIHTVIYTHGHVDHAYGTWALMEAGEKPEIVAHERLPDRFRRYLRLRGSIAKYMSQPVESLPDEEADLVWPTQTFRDELVLTIGGERFVLRHHRGETDDQLYVWVPGRKTLATADYYQGFLPNAGNGKRVQRHPEEWAAALREMAGLGAELLLPAHGAPLQDATTIRENLLVLAEALQSIVDQTIAGLNAGLRKDQVSRSVRLPEHLVRHPKLKVQYVSVQDISKMVIKRYTGWWDDVPSHWTPAPLEAQAREVVQLAGGMAPLVARTRELIPTDVQLACHLADWAFLADPEDPLAQALVLETYRARILHEDSNTMEMLSYLDAMVAARAARMRAEARAKEAAEAAR
jgi:alkyl sulfatase BDS1-like metallo-beta-lactamase superfamily hydrolase